MDNVKKVFFQYFDVADWDSRLFYSCLLLPGNEWIEPEKLSTVEQNRKSIPKE